MLQCLQTLHILNQTASLTPLALRRQARMGAIGRRGAATTRRATQSSGWCHWCGWCGWCRWCLWCGWSTPSSGLLTQLLQSCWSRSLKFEYHMFEILMKVPDLLVFYFAFWTNYTRNAILLKKLEKLLFCNITLTLFLISWTQESASCPWCTWIWSSAKRWHTKWCCRYCVSPPVLDQFDASYVAAGVVHRVQDDDDDAEPSKRPPHVFFTFPDAPPHPPPPRPRFHFSDTFTSTQWFWVKIIRIEKWRGTLAKKIEEFFLTKNLNERKWEERRRGGEKLVLGTNPLKFWY